MNKKLLALAVAGALAAPGVAVAQASNVQIYGLFDMSFLNMRYSSNTAVTGLASTNNSFSKYDVFNAASRIGFRGTEDLGNGLKAWFQAELTMFPDGRVPESTNPAGLFGARNSGVGLEGRWGNAFIGAWDSPYKQTQYAAYIRGAMGPLLHAGMIMNNADTTGAAPNAQCAAAVSPATGAGTAVGGTNAQGIVCPNQVEGAPTSFHRRLSNTIQYWSPVWSGFQVKIATQVNEGKNSSNVAGNLNTNPSLWSTGLTWANGPWNAAVAWEQHRGYNALASTAAITGSADVNVKDTAWMIGGGWNFGPGQIAAGWERLRYGDNTNALNGVGLANGYTRTNWVLNGTFKIGASGLLFGGYSKTPGGKNCGDGASGSSGVVGAALGAPGATSVCGSNSSASFASIGYQHSLSKRSSVYAVAAKINNGAGTGYYYIAAPNGPNGVSSVLPAGTDVTTLGVGMIHTF